MADPFRALQIVYLHQHFVRPGQSGGSRPWEFARRLAADGHDVTVVCGGDGNDDSVLEGVRIKSIRAPYQNSMTRAQRIWSFIVYMFRATWICLRLPADVVVASSTPLSVGIPALVRRFLRRTPFVFEVRDLWPSVPARLGFIDSPVVLRAALALERVIYRKASNVIALSPSMQEGVLQTWPLAKVEVIPNACDFSLFHFTAAEKLATRQMQGWGSEIVVVYAGSFGITYRITDLVRLAARLPEVKFVLIGEGMSSEAAEKLAEELGLDADALLPGALPRTVVARLISAADVVISSLEDVPALAGNSLNKVFDAMAAGKPVVFNHGGWLSDLLTSSAAGWRLPEDLTIAADAFRSWIADPDLLATYGRNSRMLGLQFFDRDMLYGNFQEVLVRTARSHGPRVPV